jgi:hypothetical protein
MRKIEHCANNVFARKMRPRMLQISNLLEKPNAKQKLSRQWNETTHGVQIYCLVKY